MRKNFAAAAKVPTDILELMRVTDEDVITKEIAEPLTDLLPGEESLKNCHELSEILGQSKSSL